MWLNLSKGLLFILFFLEHSSEQGNGEFSVRRSSHNLVIVAQGQALQLNITLSGTDETMPMLVFLDWNFRAYQSDVQKRLLSVTWDRGYVVSEEFYDDRASILDNASLLLVDTTLKDRGTYWCNVFSLPSQHYPVLHFNVTVQGKPRAEIQCPEKMNVIQGANFSCWCHGRSEHLIPKSSWQMEGAPPFLDGKRRNGSVELSLQNVKKTMAGIYICRIQLDSMKDETKLTLSVLYAPSIRSFRAKILKDNSMKMTCLGDGLPKPTYVIKISNGLSYTADVDGVIVIKDYKLIANASYICIAKNSVGRDQWRLNGILTFSKDETVQNQKTFLHDHVWYIIAGCSLAGILLGFLLLKTCQTANCRESESEEQNDQNSPVYVDPATISISEGRKKDPLNYIDVHVLPSMPQGGVNENMAVYVDPETVVSARPRLRETRRIQNQAFEDEQDREQPEDDDNRLYQAPEESVDDEEDSEDNQAEEEIQANPEPEATRTQDGPPNTLTKPRANTEPMLGYQDLDSSDEIEENFYHSLRSASGRQPKSHYYVNERVKPKE